MASVPQQKISAFIERYNHLLEPVNVEFVQRVFGDGTEKYARRLEQYGFDKCNAVLDAGCGFGQWSLALRSLVDSVTATDIQEGRVLFLDALVRELALDGMKVAYADLAQIPAPDASFDGIFCYGVLYTTTSWKKTLGEFARVAKPGARLYVNCNGFGYYKHTWTEQPNKSASHDPRKWAALAFYNTWRIEKGYDTVQWPLAIIEPSDLHAELDRLGFTDIVQCAEGKYRAPGYVGPGEPSFFQGEYGGDLGVYEVVAIRK